MNKICETQSLRDAVMFDGSDQSVAAIAAFFVGGQQPTEVSKVAGQEMVMLTFDMTGWEEIYPNGRDVWLLALGDWVVRSGTGYAFIRAAVFEKQFTVVA